MAGIFVQQMAFATMATAVGMAEDRTNGVIERFRALSMTRSAVLSGRTIADLAANVLGLAVLVGTGLAVGWRPHASLASVTVERWTLSTASRIVSPIASNAPLDDRSVRSSGSISSRH